ncbi:MAG: hypothetical protein COV47_02945 [Candidatus Diapherotrites archaeon CG11_big_fil_rev_8_21_14_0_20_37_9]|nr:MAG: hypothetical protein COV47_02945 [Candidatus Diapherotrites archaeon CG11_big_fil_rev_8_21_14_0_20_37_9]
MIQIKTSFHPFRLKASRKDPVELEVVLTNTGPDPALVSYEVLVSRNLSMDKSGLKSNASNRLGVMEPKQNKTDLYTIFGRHIAKAGSYPIMIRVIEHHDNYNFVMKEYKKKLELMVDE